MTHEEFARMKTGVAEVKAALLANERFGIRMVALRTEDARHAVNYIAHLEKKAEQPLPLLQGAAVPAEPSSRVLQIPSEIMNISCKPGRAISMNGASEQAYREGHRDARHAAADLILERADELAALATPASAAAPQPLAFFQALVAYKNSDKTLADDQRFADAVFGAAPLLMDERLGESLIIAMADAAHLHAGRISTVIDFARAIERATLGASPSPELPEDFTDVMYPPRAALKAEDWDPITRKPKLKECAPPVAAPVSQQEASGEVLTDDRIIEIGSAPYLGTYCERTIAFARAIEAEVERRCRAQRTNNDKPVARLQEEESDRPYSKGEKFYDIIITDRARCYDGMALYAAPPAPAPSGGDTRYAALDAAEKAVLADLVPGKTAELPIEWVTYNAAVMRAAEVIRAQATIPAQEAAQEDPKNCTCPSGDGSLRWPCPRHPPVSSGVPGEVSK